MTAAIWIANIFGWPLIHLTIARIALALPLDYFVNDNALFVERSWEDGGRTYRRRFAIQKWKSRLPDGAPWLGGFAKRRMTRRDRPYLEEFMIETRRAEFAHWCMLGCAPIFFFWNPPWACWVMVAYAMTANVPCIIAQRYNRLVLSRCLGQSRLKEPITSDMSATVR
jgi:glycosyl-4,4'-diaponeurosporenoate acyltransferase